MIHSEFIEQMERLSRVYGEKAYPSERVRLIWNKVKFRHVKVFKEAVELLIADNQHAPLLSKIREAINAVQKLHPELDIDPHERERRLLASGQRAEQTCSKCWNHGTIWAYRKDKPSNPMEVLKCDCSWGEIAGHLPENKNLPQWLHYYDYYYVLHSDPCSEEKLKPFKHILLLPTEEREVALVQAMMQQMK